jgi:HPt (histidine-containing phosphotransfer) domain-containing protein
MNALDHRTLPLNPSTEPAVHARLRAQGGEQLLAALTASFLDRSPGLLRELVGLADCDAGPEPLQRAAELAHGFKTSCRMLGALHMGDLLEAIEWSADPEDPAASDSRPLAARVAEIREEFDRVRPWIVEARQTALTALDGETDT